MPNSIGPTGLTTATRAELLAAMTLAYQTIYGPDINLDPDTPDGQQMNIFIQAVLDNLDLLTQIYNQFDPDTAIGKVLDQRVAYNGIQRQAGTFTVTPITIVTDRALNLSGLDQSNNPVYTVSDNSGTEWELMESQTIAVAGTYVFNFQAALPGATLTIPNTITTPVSIVLGVTSINNPTAALSIGLNEESDAALKIRRQKSVSLASQGYLSGLLAALENITGVSAAFVYENTSGSTDVNGVPGHSIWVIVAGTGAPADIARAIYNKRSTGAGMFGAQSYIITQVDGSPFTVYWDDVVAETVYIKFTASSLDGIHPPNVSAIRTQLVDIFVPGVNEMLNINDLATLVQQIDPNCLVTNAGFSTSATGPFTNTLSPTSKNYQFVVSSPNIIIVPITFLPATVTIPTGGTQQFGAAGGFGSYTYSFVTNASGGTISPSGLYTAGGSTGTDVVKVTDAQANFTTSTVTVV